MTQLQEGPARGTVLYADFSELRPSEVVDAPLNFNEVRDLVGTVARLGGLVIEGTARKLYCFFPRAIEALEMARYIQHLAQKAKDTDLGRMGLDVRVILGYGDVVFDRGRVRSDWTFRLAGLVTAVPQNGIGALRDFVGQFAAGAIDPPPRPSARPELFLLPLAGSQEEVTRMALDRTAAGGGGVFLNLVLRVRGVPINVRSSDCPVLIGRDKSCTVQVSGDTTSRVHGRIEFEKDKFYYVDDSRNGTYVLTGSGQEILLKREKIALVGEGAISPGAPLAKQSGEVVRFSCAPSRLEMAEATTRGDTRSLR